MIIFLTRPKVFLGSGFLHGFKSGRGGVYLIKGAVWVENAEVDMAVFETFCVGFNAVTTLCRSDGCRGHAVWRTRYAKLV